MTTPAEGAARALRVAIPVPTHTDTAYNERCWPQYAEAVQAAGGTPVRIELGLEPAETAKLVASCQAILLPGSPADVHPQKYGQEAQPETAPPDLAREATDELLLQDAFHLRKPLLGVCFGLQMMNVWRGGSLAQHLDTGSPHSPAADTGPLQHSLVLEPGASLLRAFFAAETAPVINSSHHQAIDCAGDGLRVAARSAPDGVIEALEGTTPNEQFLLGVQWHPERSFRTDAPSRAIFSAFLEAAARWHLPRS
ncbi:gamma-glutamyl-gamma-aminobutyrate hydrolase family protein [Acidipila sp. EB88]|uniref:gamma-glutamyl-gamma-aminobutyrate hydrolase family protein n=1 Tax=Acidipila sp. EB88 TaxID=2305226 RepID=UPI000F5F1C55|nr:gamma-glutamyl-gamma-aminobutyrate hydrolase family protein [Acidipila sp. EB88]RRA48199.1 gamma-glutamyl-gamma-aminobutyrate hydrolase family protein [Acidipila sp. EB88]